VIGAVRLRHSIFSGITQQAPVFESLPVKRLPRGPRPEDREGDYHMMRTVLVVTALAIGVTAASAQDPIADRKALMKRNGQMAQQGAKFIKGEEPFDLAKAQAIFAAYQDASVKAPALFPDNSKTGGDTAALPAVWEKKADFNAKLAKLGADAKDAAGKVKDEAGFKAAFTEVQKNCGGCHETYRAKKS
jgi:cytochrome c556